MRYQAVGGQFQREIGERGRADGPEALPPGRGLVIRVDHDAQYFKVAFLEFGPEIGSVKNFTHAADGIDENRPSVLLIGPEHMVFHQTDDGEFIVLPFNEQLF